MTLATTYFSTSNANTEGRKAIEVDDIMWHIGEPTDTPLIALTGGKLYKSGDDSPEEVAGRIAKKVTEQVDFKVIEKDKLTRTVTVNGAVTDTTTQTVTTDSNSACRIGDLLCDKSTGEMMFVQAVDSGGVDLTVARNLGSTAYEIADNAVLQIMGNAHKQGGSKSAMRSILASPRTRYCQISKRTFGITRTLAASQLETKVAALDEEQQQAFVEINKDIEFSFWSPNAADSTTDASSNTVYLVRGIEGELGSTYTTNCNGNLDEDFFMTTLAEEVFQYGPNRKTLFADAKFLSRVSGFSYLKQQTKPEMTKYGLRMTEVITQHGTLEIVHCGAFSEYRASSEAGKAIILDLNRVEYRYMKGRDVNMEMDIHTPGDDVIEGQYYCEVGLSLKSLAHHRIINNIG